MLTTWKKQTTHATLISQFRSQSLGLVCYKIPILKMTESWEGPQSPELRMLGSEEVAFGGVNGPWLLVALLSFFAVGRVSHSYLCSKDHTCTQVFPCSQVALAKASSKHLGSVSGGLCPAKGFCCWGPGRRRKGSVGVQQVTSNTEIEITW